MVDTAVALPDVPPADTSFGVPRGKGKGLGIANAIPSPFNCVV